MKTIDIHSHLLNSSVKFDKFVIKFFGKKFGICSEALIDNPYKEYIRTITSNTRNSEHIDKIVLFGVDDRVNDLGESIHSDITVCANEDLLQVYLDNKDIKIYFICRKS